MTAGGAESAESPRPDGAVYRAVWRWHFYAGLLCLPVLVLMAVTGGLYLFNKEIEGLVYRDLLRVPAASANLETALQTWLAVDPLCASNFGYDAPFTESTFTTPSSIRRAATCNR
jgi:hypothetical protein